MNEIRNACLVINTTEYCQTTAQEVTVPVEWYPDQQLIVQQLEEKVRQRIHGEFKERISLRTECDLFIRCALVRNHIRIVPPEVSTVIVSRLRLLSPFFESSKLYASRLLCL